MEKFRSIAEAILVLGLIIVGGVAITEPEEAKICSSRNLIMPSCDSIKPWGDGEKCFNAELGNKICPEPWLDFVNVIEIEPLKDSNTISVSANGGRFSCETENGEVNSYTRCIKDTGEDGYLGELI